MKIKHVEELVGITSKNIRFYEEQGLLSPGRADNGYREYRENDIRRLKQIKLLRKLSVPIEEIRDVLDGKISLDVCLGRQLKEYERQKMNLEAVAAFARNLIDQPADIDRLDVDQCLEDIVRLEKEGKEFMDVKVTDIRRRKTIGSVIGAAMMIGLMILLALLMWWGNSEDPVPKPVFIILIAIPAVICIGVVAVLLQRIKEIKGGEEDEAAKY